MLTFYYSKGSSALAAHILLVEAGADFTAVEISIPDGAHRSQDFLRKTPKGRIPVLETPEGLLTENPAILEYIAATHPKAGLVPDGDFAQAQARSLCAYLCSTVHVGFAHLKRGSRWADQDASLQDMRRVAPRNLAASATLLEQQLEMTPWAMGAQFSFCDPYLFLLQHWMATADLSLDPYPKLAAHNKAMRARPATQSVLDLYGSP
ncbi:glutathione S-transferase family protein [Ruegeria sp. SCPT10]|uniref:glutathione S-transferase family protein n=1 Tax=Ruegeria sp. SCP10 TaxID=3141377 RepID=UPI00333D01BB